MTVWAPNLATCYQELLTVAARLRSRRFAVGDSAVFRTQVRKGLELAQKSAQSLRYENDDIRLASYAAVSLLDEVVMNSSDPAFRDWARRPLMLDLFQTGTAGEGFFDNLRAILARKDSRTTTDLVEVYYLCMLLGFRGRFTPASEEKLEAWRNAAWAKIQRARASSSRLQISPNWRVGEDFEAPPTPIKLTRFALSATSAAAMVLVVAFVVYWLWLGRGAADLVR